MPLWQEAAVAAGVLLVVAAFTRLLHRSWPRRGVDLVAAASREAGIILALFVLWQVVRILGVTRVDGGIQHAATIWRTERTLHLPSELSLERFMLGHHGLLRAANTFYSWVHFPAMNVFLIWVFARHRDRYPSVRTAMVLLTGSCLLIQVLLPVAPPRMLTSVGFVDEAVLLGQSVYGEFGSAVAAQLSAMPSVHVGWSVLIAYEVIRISPSRWRWVILAHPIITTLVVVVTANHFWADGIVAVALLVLAEATRIGLSRFLARIRARRVRPRPPGFRRWGPSVGERREVSPPSAEETSAPAAAVPANAVPGARACVDQRDERVAVPSRQRGPQDQDEGEVLPEP